MKYLMCALAVVLFPMSNVLSQESISTTDSSLLIHQLDELMVQWHKSATDSDWSNYSKVLDSDFVFLGTDPTERWQGKEFSDFAEPYFKKGQGWDFTTNSRKWYLSPDKTIAWFEEEIDTWMNNCRGTGVWVHSKNGEWKLVHYSLSVLIENDKIGPFIQLRNE